MVKVPTARRVAQPGGESLGERESELDGSHLYLWREGGRGAGTVIGSLHPYPARPRPVAAAAAAARPSGSFGCVCVCASKYRQIDIHIDWYIYANIDIYTYTVYTGH